MPLPGSRACRRASAPARCCCVTGRGLRPGRWRSRSASRRRSSSPTSPNLRGALLRGHALDVAALANAHLFGTAPVVQQDGADAPQTSMPLVLTGIIAGNDPQNGLAILGQSAQTAKVQAVGDSVPGGARLHSVYADRVIIDRNGQLESLVLPRQLGGAAPAPSAASLPTQ